MNRDCKAWQELTAHRDYRDPRVTKERLDLKATRDLRVFEASKDCKAWQELTAHPARPDLKGLKAFKDHEDLRVCKDRKGNRVSKGQKGILERQARKGIPPPFSSTPSPKRKRSSLEAVKSVCLAIPVIT